MKTVLITGGGCEEAIDGVRSVTNFSSGKTSASLATFFYNAGWSVTLLAGKRAIVPNKISKINVIRFGGFDDLERLLEESLRNEKYDAVIHAAAVSDFSIARIKVNGKEYTGGTEKKISSNEELTVIMKPNSKILPRLKDWGSDPFIVGFKLTNNALDKRRMIAVNELLKEKGVDLVVSNDLSEIDQDIHLFKILDKNGRILATGKNKTNMGESLLKQIDKHMDKGERL